MLTEQERTEIAEIGCRAVSAILAENDPADAVSTVVSRACRAMRWGGRDETGRPERAA